MGARPRWARGRWLVYPIYSRNSWRERGPGKWTQRRRESCEVPINNKVAGKRSRMIKRTCLEPLSAVIQTARPRSRPRRSAEVTEITNNNRCVQAQALFFELYSFLNEFSAGFHRHSFGVWIVRHRLNDVFSNIVAHDRIYITTHVGDQNSQINANHYSHKQRSQSKVKRGAAQASFLNSFSRLCVSCQCIPLAIFFFSRQSCVPHFE